MTSPVGERTERYQMSPNSANLQKFLEVISKGSSILVIGCGDGKLNSDISQDDYRVIGIDLDPEKIISAKNTFLALEFHATGVLEMKFDTEFQGVWLGSFFSKMEEGEQKEVLEKIKQVMDEKAWLYLSCPNQQKGAFTSLVEKAGFKVEHEIVDYEHQLICQRNG